MKTKSFLKLCLLIFIGSVLVSCSHLRDTTYLYVTKTDQNTIAYKVVTPEQVALKNAMQPSLLSLTSKEAIENIGLSESQVKLIPLNKEYVFPITKTNTLGWISYGIGTLVLFIVMGAILVLLAINTFLNAILGSTVDVGSKAAGGLFKVFSPNKQDRL